MSCGDVPGDGLWLAAGNRALVRSPYEIKGAWPRYAGWSLGTLLLTNSFSEVWPGQSVLAIGTGGTPAARAFTVRQLRPRRLGKVRGPRKIVSVSADRG